MPSILAAYKPEQLKRAAAPSRLEVRAHLGFPEDTVMLREQEKSLMTERKRVKMLLETWDPMIVSDKAKRDFTSQLEDLNLRLRQLRRQMGK